MIFTYTYRNHTGALAHGEIDAADRAAAFVALRSHGIVPVKLELGRSPQVRGRSSSGDSGLRNGFPMPRWGLWFGVALLAITIGSSLLWWLHSSRAASDSNTGKPSRQKTETVTEKRSDAQSRGVSDGESRPQQITAKPESTSMSQSVQTPNRVTPATVPIQETNTLADISEKTAPVFSNVTDQVITMVLSPSDGGIPPIPLTPDMEQAFLKSLKTEIVILDTDDEKTRALKQSVKETREEIKRLMDQGVTFTQVIRDHQRLVNENAKVRQELLLELKRIRDSGDIDGAVKFRREMNAALQQMGIKELTLPVTEAERAEREAARQERLRQRREQAALQNTGTAP